MSHTCDQTMRLTLMTDGTVEIWLDRERPAFEVAQMIHDIATGFENDARRIG